MIFINLIIIMTYYDNNRIITIYLYTNAFLVFTKIFFIHSIIIMTYYDNNRKISTYLHTNDIGTVLMLPKEKRTNLIISDLRSYKTSNI